MPAQMVPARGQGGRAGDALPDGGGGGVVLPETVVLDNTFMHEVYNESPSEARCRRRPHSPSAGARGAMFGLA